MDGEVRGRQPAVDANPVDNGQGGDESHQDDAQRGLVARRSLVEQHELYRV
jgi:hypothetical protein